MEDFLNYHLPEWYPMVMLGVYLWTSFLHKHDYEVLANESADKVLSCFSYILLFGSELLYFVLPHAGGGMFYYMDPDVVGWLVTIIAVVLTAIVIFKQFFHYIDFAYSLHEHTFVAYSGMFVFLLSAVLVILRMFGLFETFLDEYMSIIILAVVGFHLLAIVILNFKEGTHWLILLEIPLFFLGLLAFSLVAIVALLYVVFVFVLGMFTASSDSSSSGSDEEAPLQSCKECLFYDISGHYCNYYKSDKDPYTTNETVIHYASSCPGAARRR